MIAAELRRNKKLNDILDRTTNSHNHLHSTSNYVNPYLFRYSVMMRLGCTPPEMLDLIPCPGCSTELSASNALHHVAGCTQCSGVNATRKHTHLIRFLGELCAKAGLPHVLEPRVHTSFYCTKCKASISDEAVENHPCKARRIRSGPDLGIMWLTIGEVLYDLTVVHTCAPSHIKSTPEQLMQNALERKNTKYVVEKGISTQEFSCLAVTEFGQLHQNTRRLLECLAKRSERNVNEVKEEFQLEIEKMNAYTVANQLRKYMTPTQWLGELQQ